MEYFYYENEYASEAEEEIGGLDYYFKGRNSEQSEQYSRFEELLARCKEDTNRLSREYAAIHFNLDLKIQIERTRSVTLQNHSMLLNMEEQLGQMLQMLQAEKKIIPSQHVGSITHEIQENNQEHATNYWSDSDEEVKSEVLSIHPDEDFCLENVFEKKSEEDTIDDFLILLTDDGTKSEIDEICEEIPDHEITMEELDEPLETDDQSVIIPKPESTILKDESFDSGNFLHSYLSLDLHFQKILINLKSEFIKIFGFQPFPAFCLDVLKIKRGKGKFDFPFDNG